MVGVAVASWLPAGWGHAAAATSGTPRTAIFLYPDGLLVLRFDTGADDIRTAVVENRDIETIETSHSSHWYFEYQHGGAENAVAWADGATPANATIRFRFPVLDLGRDLAFPLPGQERRYPGAWDLIRVLPERILGQVFDSSET